MNRELTVGRRKDKSSSMGGKRTVKDSHKTFKQIKRKLRELR